MKKMKLEELAVCSFVSSVTQPIRIFGQGGGGGGSQDRFGGGVGNCPSPPPP